MYRQNKIWAKFCKDARLEYRGRLNKRVSSILARLSQSLKITFLIKICPLSVVMVIDVKSSESHLPLYNHFANYNLTRHTEYLSEVKGIQISSNKGQNSVYKMR